MNKYTVGIIANLISMTVFTGLIVAFTILIIDNL